MTSNGATEEPGLGVSRTNLTPLRNRTSVRSLKMPKQHSSFLIK